MPLQGGPLACLAMLWIAGRAGVLMSARIGTAPTAFLDLIFPLAFLGVVTPEIVARRNWRNLPMLAALASLLRANLLVHLEALGVAATAEPGSRLSIATLLMLISVVGGRIIPSFTRNWLARERPEIPPPAVFCSFDRAALAVTALTPAPVGSRAGKSRDLVGSARRGTRAGRASRTLARFFDLARAAALGASSRPRLARAGFCASRPQQRHRAAASDRSAPRADCGRHQHNDIGGHDPGLARPYWAPTCRGAGNGDDIFLITLAAVLCLLAPLPGARYLLLLALAGAAWSGAFGLFALVYARPLLLPRVP